MDRRRRRSRGVNQTLVATAEEAPREADIAFDHLYRVEPRRRLRLRRQPAARPGRPPRKSPRPPSSAPTASAPASTRPRRAARLAVRDRPQRRPRRAAPPRPPGRAGGRAGRPRRRPGPRERRGKRAPPRPRRRPRPPRAARARADRAQVLRRPRQRRDRRRARHLRVERRHQAAPSRDQAEGGMRWSRLETTTSWSPRWGRCARRRARPSPPSSTSGPPRASRARSRRGRDRRLGQRLAACARARPRRLLLPAGATALAADRRRDRGRRVSSGSRRLERTCQALESPTAAALGAPRRHEAAAPGVDDPAARRRDGYGAERPESARRRQRRGAVGTRAGQGAARPMAPAPTRPRPPAATIERSAEIVLGTEPDRRRRGRRQGLRRRPRHRRHRPAAPRPATAARARPGPSSSC